MTESKTLIELFLNRVEKSGSRAAVHSKNEGTFQARTWEELAHDVFELCSVLVGLGIQPGDRVAHWSPNRYEWIVADFAIQACQAIHVPMHDPISGAQAVYQTTHSGSKLLLVSGPMQLKKLAPHVAELPNVPCLMHDEGTATLGSNDVACWRSRVDGSKVADGSNVHVGQETANRARATATEDDVVTILYTSGTTGEPKGVTLTQRNVVSNVHAVLQTFDENESDLRLCFLPLSHIFARTCDLYTWIGSGAQFALAESRDSIVPDCQAIQPTIINGVPYFYEKIQNGLTAAGAGDVPGALKQMLGGRLRACCSGGAALSVHTFDFFQMQQVPILQGYGLTETAPVLAMSTEDTCKRGTVGPPLIGVEIRIADDHEILARGPNIMTGYWNDPEATTAAIVDGWFHTGDLGELDDDGYLRITGRKKELIVTATGKNIAPSLLESLLCRDPIIEQAMVIGDDRKYLGALLVPNVEQLSAALEKRNIQIAKSEEMLTNEVLTNGDVSKLFEERVQQQLADLAHHEQVGRFVVLNRGFTLEAGHVTPKASLRRDKITVDFAEEIERLFAS